MHRHEFKVFADYHQFYIQDDDVAYGNLSDAWTAEAVEMRMAVASHVVGVGTVRNIGVPVTVEVFDREPTIDYTEWDQVNLASIEVSTGRIVVAGCTDYFPEAARIELPPGTYLVLVCYSGMISADDGGLVGADRYLVALYGGPLQEPQVLKAAKNG